MIGTAVCTIHRLDHSDILCICTPFNNIVGVMAVFRPGMHSRCLVAVRYCIVDQQIK